MREVNCLKLIYDRHQELMVCVGGSFQSIPKSIAADLIQPQQIIVKRMLPVTFKVWKLYFKNFSTSMKIDHGVKNFQAP